MRKLHGDDSAGFEQALHARYEVIQIRHMGQNIVAEQKVRLTILGDDLVRAAASRESTPRCEYPCPAPLWRRSPPLDAEYRYTGSDKVLQQVAVVTGDLEDQTSRPKLKRSRINTLYLTCVLHPAVGIGGKVGVFVKDVGRRDIFFQLHQEAALTDPGVQGIERLHVIELMPFDVRLAQR